MEGLNLPECVCRSGSRSPKEYNMDSISIRDTASQLSKIRLTWPTFPKAILIIYKEEVNEAGLIAKEISNFIRAKNPETIGLLAEHRMSRMMLMSSSLLVVMERCCSRHGSFNAFALPSSPFIVAPWDS